MTEEAGAEAAAEIGALGFAGLGLGLVAVGLIVLPLRRAVMRRLLHDGPLAPAAFRWGDVFAALGIFLLSSFVVSAVAIYRTTGKWEPSDEDADPLEQIGFTGQALMMSLIFLGPCLYVAWTAIRRTRGLEALGVRGLTPARVPFGRTLAAVTSILLGAPFVFGAAHLTNAFFEARGLELPVQDVATAIRDEITRFPWRVALFAVVVIPFLEEVLFRGFLLELLRDKLGLAAGVILSSALFGLAHGLAAAPSIFVLAVILALVKLRTRSLYAAWVIHAMNNGSSLVLQQLSETP